MQNELYSNATRSTIDAIKSDAKTANQWKTAGIKVAECFETESALTEAKAQFIADAILPALDRKHAAALIKELPRKGSKEYNALDQSGRDTWEAANQTKKDARAIRFRPHFTFATAGKIDTFSLKDGSLIVAVPEESSDAGPGKGQRMKIVQLPAGY